MCIIIRVRASYSLFFLSRDRLTSGQLFPDCLMVKVFFFDGGQDRVVVKASAS